jgi:hypothetical protein
VGDEDCAFACNPYPTCSEHFELNTETCQCEPECGDVVCTSPLSLDYRSCTCECALTCPEHFELNTETCQCEPECGDVVCTSPLSLDYRTCTCKCNLRCGPGVKLNQEGCFCECVGPDCDDPWNCTPFGCDVW